jgi:hypothetical protein
MVVGFSGSGAGRRCNSPAISRARFRIEEFHKPMRAFTMRTATNASRTSSLRSSRNRARVFRNVRRVQKKHPPSEICEVPP